MRADEVRGQVLDVIKSGWIPRGGPSELAAYDLIDNVPLGHWERWIAEAAERLRGQDSGADR